MLKKSDICEGSIHASRSSREGHSHRGPDVGLARLPYEHRSLELLSRLFETVLRIHLPGIKAGLAVTFAVAPGFSSATLITLCNLLVLPIRCIARGRHTACCTLLRMEKSVGRFVTSIIV
jgi:hypothetical protein